MYTIKRAAELTGVTPATLRAWEARYGVARPQRTASGYRLYDEAALAEIRRMLELLADGWSPAQAAAATLGVAGLPKPTLPPNLTNRELIERLLAAAESLDTAVLTAGLDATFADSDFDSVCREVLMPLLARLGSQWEAGKLTISSEHVLSHAIARRMSALFEAARPASGPLALVGLPSGSRHELAALAFSVSLRQKNVQVTYLGPDTPTDAWLTALDAQPANAVAISVMTLDAVAPAAATAQRIHQERPELVIAAGGRFAHSLPAFVDKLPADIGSAATHLKSQLTTTNGESQ